MSSPSASGPLRLILLGREHPHVPDYLAVAAEDPRLELVTGSAVELRGASSEEIDALLGTADLAVVTSTTAGHAGLLELLVRRRIPVLLEKPLAGDPERGVALASLWDDAAPGSRIALLLRASGAVGELRREIDRLELLAGPCRVRLAFCHDQLDSWRGDPDRAWLLDRDRGGVGSPIDLGYHLIDLLGLVDPSAVPTPVAGSLRLEPGIAVPVAGTARLLWGGHEVEIVTDWDAPARLGLEFIGVDAEVRLLGEELRVREGDRITLRGVVPPRAGSSLSAMVDALLAADHGEHPRPAPLPDAASLLRIERLAHAVQEIGAA